MEAINWKRIDYKEKDKINPSRWQIHVNFHAAYFVKRIELFAKLYLRQASHITRIIVSIEVMHVFSNGTNNVKKKKNTCEQLSVSRIVPQSPMAVLITKRNSFSF